MTLTEKTYLHCKQVIPGGVPIGERRRIAS